MTIYVFPATSKKVQSRIIQKWNTEQKNKNKKIKIKVNQKVGSYHYVVLRQPGKKAEGDAIS